jgi:hypothetical protein
MTFPEGNLFGIDAGTYAPGVDDGYYLTLAPRSPGQHTIHFTAANRDHSFSLDDLLTDRGRALPRQPTGRDILCSARLPLQSLVAYATKSRMHQVH